jgi:hypothetical protein
MTMQQLPKSLITELNSDFNSNWQFVGIEDNCYIIKELKYGCEWEYDNRLYTKGAIDRGLTHLRNYKRRDRSSESELAAKAIDMIYNKAKSLEEAEINYGIKSFKYSYEEELILEHDHDIERYIWNSLLERETVRVIVSGKDSSYTFIIGTNSMDLFLDEIGIGERNEVLLKFKENADLKVSIQGSGTLLEGEVLVKENSTYNFTICKLENKIILGLEV